MTRKPDFGSLGFFANIPQASTFANIKNILDVREMPASTNPQRWLEGDTIDLPEHFMGHDGVERSTATFLADSETSALLVLKNGAVRYERYWLTAGPDTQWLSMSVAKSWISALVGIAVADGHIASIDESISAYIDVDPGSAYDGVSISDVLQMSSGARWNEDYGDPTSDAQRLGSATAHPDGSLERFVAAMARESEPGTVCQYNSADTQALGQLLVKATGRSIADYMHETLVEPLGFEQPAYWVLDPQGMEVAFAGVNMTARDFARLGELYRLGGTWNGTQLVPAEWVVDSTRAHSTVQEPFNVRIAGEPLPFGYGYQWWLSPIGDGSFEAAGVYGQSVLVVPRKAVTIVRLAATTAYGHPADVWSEFYGDLLIAIADSID